MTDAEKLQLLDDIWPVIETIESAYHFTHRCCLHWRTEEPQRHLQAALERYTLLGRSERELVDRMMVLKAEEFFKRRDEIYDAA